MKLLREEPTASVCPVCLRRIPAVRKITDEGVILTRTCPEHGEFSAVLWKGRMDYAAWRGDLPFIREGENLSCAQCGGLCSEHRRNSCCVLLEVTKRCNLHCRFCFAEAGDDPAPDPTFEQLQQDIFGITAVPGIFLQLSGGEPTVRGDLPEIVSFARMCGCRYIQLNTNGLHLAEDEDYVRRLAEAGLTIAFLQFDGTEDEIYRTLRGRELFAVKQKAVEVCAKFGIGVTLVPTLVRGVNDRHIGEILRYAVSQSPAVRGVHFQPVSYFGRIPGCPGEEDRITLDELMTQIEEQTDGLIRAGQLTPSCCDHPLCGFHGDFIVLPDRSLMPLSGGKGCGSHEDPALRNREYIGNRWSAASGTGEGESEGPLDMTDMDTFLRRKKSHGFTVTSMDFQDAGNLDIERLRQCSLHVYREGKRYPFCAAYLTPLTEGGQDERL